MMSLNGAIAYGKRIGVQFYVISNKNTIYAGTQTYDQAVEKKRKYEEEERLHPNPWEKNPITFRVIPVSEYRRN